MFISETKPESRLCGEPSRRNDGGACKNLIYAPRTKCPSHGGGKGSDWRPVWLWIGPGEPPQGVQEVPDEAHSEPLFETKVEPEVPVEAVEMAPEALPEPVQAPVEALPVTETPAQQYERLARLRGKHL